MRLATFFETMHGMLTGELSARQAEHRLGPSPSGTVAFGFYREHIERHAFRILRELFPTLPGLVERCRPGAWRALVLRYLAEHPPRDRDPNAFGAAMVDHLRTLRSEDPTWPPWLEEVADYHGVQFRVGASASIEGGFDETIFVRQYGWPIPGMVAALRRDPDAPVPPAQLTRVVVYRCMRRHEVRTMRLGIAELTALARHQGLSLPPVLAALPVTSVAAARSRLVDAGVLSAEH